MQTKLGINISGTDGHDWLTNLRFADDILLVGTTCEMMRDMLVDLKVATADDGHQLYMGKRKF